MSTKASSADKRTKKNKFKLFGKNRGDQASVDTQDTQAPRPTTGTSASVGRGTFNKKDGLHNLSQALELLRSVGEGNELLAPLKAVCGGLKVIVDTAQALQQNDEDLRDLNARLNRQLHALVQQEETLSSSKLNISHKGVDQFVAALRTYITDLNKVQEVLENIKPKEKGRFKRFTKTVWTVQSVGEDIKDCSRQLDESFQLFMNSVTSFIAYQAVLLRNEVAEIRAGFDEKNAKDALNGLPRSNARGIQHSPCLQGTRSDMLEGITKWASDGVSEPVFALIDRAGTGKSTISLHMAQKWEKDGCSIARFFFSLPNSVTTGTDFATTLARDLADKIPSLRPFILEAINDHPNYATHSIQEKLDWFVFVPLKRMKDSYKEVLERLRGEMLQNDCTKVPENAHEEISGNPRIKAAKKSYTIALEKVRRVAGDEAPTDALGREYVAYIKELENAYVEALSKPPIIVVDALDECSVADRRLILESILSFLGVNSAERYFRVFLTCRPEKDVISQLQDSRYDNLIRRADFGMGIEKNTSNDDDIALYTNRYLGSILSTPEIAIFVARAAGLFIWASTARAFLEEADDPSARFQILVTHDAQESPLNSLYDDILHSAVERAGRDQVESLKKVLQGVCAAREPINTKAMDELLGLSNGVACRVVMRLASVLSDAADGKPVQVLHPTFIEYFQAGSRVDRLSFSEKEAESLLACGCLEALLSRQLRYDICDTTQPHTYPPENKEIEALDQRLEERTTAGLRYAARHGLSHIACSLLDGAVVTNLRRFFENNLLYWVELVSLLGGIYRLMVSIHELKRRIEDGMEDSEGILTVEDKNWCEEILSLIRPFQAAIEESASQVYFSAFPFAPPTSKIFHFYHKKIAGKSPKVLHGAWSASSTSIVLGGHASQITCLAFSPDGRRLASGSHDRTVRLWDAETGAAVGEPLAGHNGWVTCLSFSPDGRRLASGSHDHTVRLWDAETGAAVGEPLAGHSHSVTCLSFSPDGRRLASGSHDRTVRLWDAETGAAVGEPLAGHNSWVKCLSFSPDGRRLASGSHDRTVRLWDAETGAAVGEPLAGHNGWVTCLSFSPDGRRLASGSHDHTVRLWDAETGAAVGEPLAGHSHSVTCLSFSPDGRRLASGSHDDTVRLWDAETGAAVGEPLAGHSDSVTCLSFSPDGRRLASGSHDDTVRLWDAETGAAVGEPLAGHSDSVTCLSFSPDGRRLASGSHDHTVRLWDAETGAAVGEPLAGHSYSVTCLSFSPDGRRLASGSHDRTVRLWDAETGAAVGEPLAGHSYSVTCLSFSPDGRRLASGSSDDTIRLWDAETGAAVGEPLAGHSDSVTCLSFSPDGRRLASGSGDHTVHLWDAETGVAVGEPLACGSYIRYLTFHVDNEILHLTVNDSIVWNLSARSPCRFDPSNRPGQSPLVHTPDIKFDAPWTYLQSSPCFRFCLPSNIRGFMSLAHKGKLAYGGIDGSVIIIDCTHLI